MIFWMMAMKLMMIDFQLMRRNPSLQEIPTYQYTKRDGNQLASTIGGQQTVNEMQQNLMG